MKEVNSQKRRHFLNLLLRGGTLAALTWVSGNLGRRWLQAEECDRGFTCNSCIISGSCRLPEADSYRLEQAKQTDKRRNGRSPGQR